MRSLAGHYWTFRPYLGHALRPVGTPPSRHFEAVVTDPERGAVPLSGRLSRAGSSEELCVVVHGLGGSSRSYYAIRAAAEAHAMGLDALRLNLRGADRSGADIYHAGLTDDLRAALGSARLDGYRRIYLLGFSLGGHAVLRYLAEGPDARVSAAAAVCSPIDLAAGVAAIDRAPRAVYRAHVLRGLKEIYREVATRHTMPVPIVEAEAIRTLREWDERIVAPRFGFRDAEDYWASTTVAPMLDRVDVETLFVCAEHDPMVLCHTVRPSLRKAPHIETVYVSRGGHVGFPEDLDLGMGLRAPMERQVLRWLRWKGAGSPLPSDVSLDAKLPSSP